MYENAILKPYIQTAVFKKGCVILMNFYCTIFVFLFFQTISRSSNRSRRSRLDSASANALHRGQGSDSESDDEEGGKPVFEPADFQTVDIHDEKAFDTDLEIEGRLFYHVSSLVSHATYPLN